MSNNNTKYLQNAAIIAVTHLLDEKPGLLTLEAHEQAISHRIAVHLEPLFQGLESGVLKIDCEYNKHLEKSKRVDVLAIGVRALQRCGCPACNALRARARLADKLFRPDIVVHGRNTDKMNLLAMEIKRHKQCPFDCGKLMALTLPKADGGRYCYQLGVFICFPKGKPNYKWFVNGREL